MSEPFLLGVNYWPRRKAVFWWSDFDAGEVREEFALIRDLGLNVVRMFLLWDDFQPAPDTVDAAALDHLTTVADIAADLGLGLEPTFFVGHMSGPNWAPRWLLGGPLPHHPWIKEVVSVGKLVEGGYRNMFHDPIALSAERLLLRRVVSALKDHPGIWMWSLGNEPDLFAWPQDAAAGRAWVRQMTTLIHEIDSNHPVSIGLHGADLEADTGLRVDQCFAETDRAVMHAYSIYSDVARQPLDPDFPAYNVALTAALCGKPVLLEEFGSCTAPPGQPSYVLKWRGKAGHRQQFLAAEEDLAEFLRQALPKLVQVGGLGAFIWCFADYAEHLWNQPPCADAVHERFFGLVRPDGSLKPHAYVLKEFAAARPQVQPIPDWARLEVDPEAYYRSPQEHFRRLYSVYLERMSAQP